MQTNKIFLINVLIIVINQLIFAQDDRQFILDVIDRFYIYSNNFKTEKVFIHTDKTVYQPGEKVWFKAYIAENSNSTSSGLSKKLFINLYDKENEILSSEIYKIENGKSNGDFIIPFRYEYDQIKLVAYTSWMMNGGQPVFIKILNVKNKLIPGLLISVDLKNNLYSLQKEINALINVLDVNGKPVEKASYSCFIIRN